MQALKLRNKKAEDEFRRLLARWQEACRNMDQYDETALKFLFERLEYAWKRIGYEIGGDT